MKGLKERPDSPHKGCRVMEKPDGEKPQKMHRKSTLKTNASWSPIPTLVPEGRKGQHAHLGIIPTLLHREASSPAQCPPCWGPEKLRMPHCPDAPQHPTCSPALAVSLPSLTLLANPAASCPCLLPPCPSNGLRASPEQMDSFFF